MARLSTFSLRHRLLPVLAAVILVVMFALAAREHLRPTPLNVIVLTVESWRADSATPQALPNLFAAAQGGVRFDNHRAVSAWTAPNVITLLTGIAPLQQGSDTRGDSLAPDADILPARLSARGWRVSGLQAFMLIDLFRNLGFDYELGTSLRGWLAGRMREREPFFLWHHYLDTHLPYNPAGAEGILAAIPLSEPGEAARRNAVRTMPAIPDGAVAFRDTDHAWVDALYRGGVSDFDRWFGQFWAFFEQSGLRETTVLVVTADHGEELLERGLVGHASTTRAGHLHEEIVRVPLFVWAPPAALPQPPGSVVRAPTDHRMIAPTLAAMLGVEAPATRHMPGLFETASPPGWVGFSSRAGFAEPDPADVDSFVLAAIEGSLKVQLHVENGAAVRTDAWDLARDPDERDALDPRPAAADRIAARLMGEFAARRQPHERAAGTGLTRAGAVPRWVHPAASRPVGYRDIAEATYISWTGDPGADYVVAYEAGLPPLALSGTIEVNGTRHDFGSVSERYWDTWVVPYNRVRFRVRPANAIDAWSEWLELMVKP